jgi:hypothetical protein
MMTFTGSKMILCQKGEYMKTILCVILLMCAVVLNFAPASSAPIPPAGPFDISGTINEAQWVPDHHIKGKPGFSGSLGHDRTVAAHFVVKLVHYHGVDAKNAIRITRYVYDKAYGDRNPTGMPPFIMLKLDSKDKNFLKAGKNIVVRGYTVRGDEGGTWTSFTGISVQ